LICRACGIDIVMASQTEQSMPSGTAGWIASAFTRRVGVVSKGSVARSRAGTQANPATFGSVNAESFVPGGHAVVARTAIRTIGIADIAIFFGDHGVRAAKKRLPHFLEAGAAVFAVKQVKYSGHDRTLA
jgi:hypothetical protein